MKYKSITIDEDVVQALEKLKTADENTNKTMRRLLNLPESRLSKKKKYFFEHLESGHSVMVPYVRDELGQVTNGYAIDRAIRHASKKFAMEFRSEYSGSNMRVTRLR